MARAQIKGSEEIEPTQKVGDLARPQVNNPGNQIEVVRIPASSHLTNDSYFHNIEGIDLFRAFG